MPCLAMPCHALLCLRQGRAWQGMARHGKAWQGMARHSKASAKPMPMGETGGGELNKIIKYGGRNVYSGIGGIDI
jgi:hypothetical protein